LPQPLGPASATISPGATSNEILSSARIVWTEPPAPISNVLEIFSSRTLVASSIISIPSLRLQPFKAPWRGASSTKRLTSWLPSIVW
jgi:hypothetical protein